MAGTLAWRLLTAYPGTQMLRPPYDAAWTRSPSNPIISPTVAWEETAVAEVGAAWYEAGTWRVWYSGGWNNPGLGYASGSDPTSLTKYAGNPVLGQGGSGLAGPTASPRIVRDGATLHAYVSSGSPLRSTILHYTGTDGLAWTAAPLTITLPPGATLWGNREVWREGLTWYMLHDAMSATGYWEVWLYVSSDGETWSILNGGTSLTSLQVAAGGMYGGMRFAQIDGTLMPKPDGTHYEMWFHAAPGAGNLPTDIYHATSTDRINWTVNGPVLTHSGSGFEVDQVAGPVPVVVGSSAYLFYDGDDNPASSARIGLATAAALP